MITPDQASRTRAATHLALIGASSPALTFQSRSDTEKYRTAMAPMTMKVIFGANGERGQIAVGIGEQNQHSAEDVHHHAENSQGEQPMHGGERQRFPAAQHAQ